ncbi:MAG: site-specific integrase, partial [Candidatus Nanohaloarchaea archaeon]|nr:site-specific integrase [Candidatus Nanohaloarchaea archaeon]
LERIQKSPDITDRNKEELLAFKDFLAAQNLSTGRIYRYLYTFYQLRDHIDFSLEDAEKEDIVQLVGKINNDEVKEMADETKKEYKKAIKKFYGDYLDDKLHDFDGEEYTEFFSLTVTSTLPDPDELPTPSTVQALVEETDDPRNKAIIMVMWSTGGRISEILGLQWRDVTFKDRVATVTFRDTKTGGDRTVPLHTGHRYLADHKQNDNKSGDPDEYVFRSRQGDNGQLSYRAVYNMLQRLRRKDSVKEQVPDKVRTNPHAFRKGRATWFAAKGKSQAWLCEYFGWVQGSDEAAKYIRLAKSDVEAGLLEAAGLEQKENGVEDDLQPVQCHGCGQWNTWEADNCRECGTVITPGEQYEEVQVEETTEKLKWELIKDNTDIADEDAIREKARELVQEQLAEA